MRNSCVIGGWIVDSGEDMLENGGIWGTKYCNLGGRAMILAPRPTRS